MTTTDKFEELELLLSQIEDEGGSRERYDRLNALLHGDPEACEFYLNYQELIATLDQHFAAQPVELADDERPEKLVLRTTQMILQQSPRVATTMWNNPWWIGAAASIMATGMIVGLFALSGGNDNKPLTDGPIVTEIAEEGVAVMARTLEANFLGDPPQPEERDILSTGPLELESGFAQLEMYNGARVLLEGPAKMELVGEDSVFLSTGRMRADVPPQAESLRVLTPQGEFVSADGEFAVAVEGLQSTELHHFDGRLDYRTETTRDFVSHTAGDALLVEANGDAVYYESADSKEFISWVDILESSRANAHGRYRDWRASTGDLMNDPRVRVYYTFDDQESSDRTLFNHAGLSSDQDGVIVGSRWVQGRWRDKKALTFSRSSDRVRFNVDGDAEAMTFASWVRFDRAPGRVQTLISPDQLRDGVPQWRIDDKGHLQVEVVAKDGKASEVAISAQPVLTKKSQHRWIHIASVIDRKTKTVSHFVNGEALGESKLKTTPDLRLGRVQLGNSAHGGKQPRHFMGRVDELILFTESLGESEINKLYSEGRPW
ncbi:MAG: LamG domain-containing protein [Verrucomicrobiota bacterium]